VHRSDHRSDDRFTGQTVLITGATGGMGSSHARAYHREGASVVIAGRDVDAGRALVAELTASARSGAQGVGRAAAVRLDVTSEEDWRSAVTATEERFGPMTVLVNNAGVQAPAAVLEQTDPTVWRRTVDINLTGAFLGIKATTASLRRAGGGSIVNVASTTARGGTPFFGPYVASKWALRGLTQTAALELGRDGIRVNTLLPGVVSTPLITTPTAPGETPIADVYSPDAYAVPRVAQPQEISDLLLHLTAPSTTFITGAEFVIDGGLLLGPALPREQAA
jgi:3alpha(or 20beta)-hydroxysteroid dehydrogenase